VTVVVRAASSGDPGGYHDEDGDDPGPEWTQLVSGADQNQHLQVGSGGGGVTDPDQNHSQQRDTPE
jgi:hypothetical protein